MNELAGPLSPPEFGANAAWLRLNVILYTFSWPIRASAYPRHFHAARPKRLRFFALNTVGKVVRHARETLSRCTEHIARSLAEPPRTYFVLKHSSYPELEGLRHRLARTAAPEVRGMSPRG